LTPSTPSISTAIVAPGTSTLTRHAITGFSGAVNTSAQVTPASLTAGLSPSNPSTSLAPSTVNLQPQSTGSSTLTVSASLLTTPGTYTVTITATSGTVSHTTQVPVTVTVAGLI